MPRTQSSLENKEIILEALADYRKWYEGEDEHDQYQKERIDKAIREVKAL
jgi:peptide methionine sulfoxide reductase MsrA